MKAARKILLLAAMVLVGLIAYASIKPVLAVKFHTNQGLNVINCGPKAPKIGGEEAGCNPDDPLYNCCSDYGLCGTGREFCDCPGCRKYQWYVSHGRPW